MYSDCKAINHKRAECTHKTQTQKPQHQATHGRGCYNERPCRTGAPLITGLHLCFCHAFPSRSIVRVKIGFYPVYTVMVDAVGWIFFLRIGPLFRDLQQVYTYIYIYTYTIAPMPGFGAQGCRGNCFCTSRRYCDPEPSTLDPNPCHLNPIHL